MPLAYSQTIHNVSAGGLRLPAFFLDIIMEIEFKEIDDRKFLVVEGEVKPSIKFVVNKPKDLITGERRLQYDEMAHNMRYAATLNLPVLEIQQFKPYCNAIIVAAGPSIKTQVDKIKEFAKAPGNAVFAINWAHTWLIRNGIVPNGCLLFEVDAEPLSLMTTLHKDVTYYICSHCNTGTFTALEGYKRVLWHTAPQDDLTREVREILFKDQIILGGGTATFMLTISLALTLGYRDFDVFGADSSYPVDSTKTHIDGYPAAVTDKEDGMDVYARNPISGEVRHFKTVGYLAHQVEEFHKYCLANHQFFRMRLHGDGLLQWQHRVTYPKEYEGR